MNRKKRLAAVLLTALMAALCCVPTLAVSRRYNTYVVLGDSIAAGYLLPGYKYGGKEIAAWTVTKGSYPFYIAKGVDASKTYQMAHGGYRTEELRLLLDDSYRGDIIGTRRLPTKNGGRELDEKAIARLKKDFRANIAKADLITLNVGSNDCTQAFAALRDMTEEDVSIAMSLAFSDRDPISTLGESLAYALKLTGDSVTMARLAELELESYLVFQQNFDAIVRQIRALNSHAKLVVLGVYNPVEVASVNLLLLNVQYGQLLNPVVSIFNTYMQSQSAYRDQYTFVPMRNIETYVGIGRLDMDPDILMDAHPTPTGHRQMAEQVLAVL